MPFLDFAHHVDRELRFGVLLFDEVGQGRVDGVASDRVGALIFGIRHLAVNTAKVGGARADVDDQGVVEEVEAVGDREGFPR